MPKVLEVGRFIFYFYSNEFNEPPHIHVRSAERYAKFWLFPVALTNFGGYNSSELKEIEEIVTTRRAYLKREWDKRKKHESPSN